MSWLKNPIIKNLIKEFKRILKIENNKKRLEQYDKLAHEIVEKPKIKRIILGFNWVYFYPIEGYDKKGNEIIGPQLGKIHKAIYDKNKKIIEELTKAGNIDELRKFFEIKIKSR